MQIIGCEVVNELICEIQVHGFDAHRYKLSDIDGQQHWSSMFKNSGFSSERLLDSTHFYPKLSYLPAYDCKRQMNQSSITNRLIT
ncbi:hypothetical protein ACTXT7_014274 [Hymenolepis weldensis]